MSYSFLTNVYMPAKNGAYAFFALKQHLKSVGWTVPLSSDGTTYNGSGDQITQVAAGAGGMDNPLAWYVVRSPDSAHSFCLQRSSLGYAGTPLEDSKWWRIKISVNGFTGGTATVVASAADEGLIFGNSTNAAPDFDRCFDDNIVDCRSGLYHVCAQTVAPYQFWACTFTTFTDFTSMNDGLIMMEAMASGSYPAGDVDPFVYTVTDTFTTTSYAYVRKGLADEQLNVVWPITVFDTFPGNMDVDPITFKTDLAPTMYAVVGQRYFGGVKGISQLTKQLGVDRGPFGMITVASVGDYISIGEVQYNEIGWLVPWDGSIPDRSV